VIDEPEAHLDSALIARYLVDLIKVMKRNRQIIFATHNANFVVNGDAELIHVLDMGADNRTISYATTLENLDHRDRLMALEGGPDAFRLRERRYGVAEFAKPMVIR
jgi:predicted ATP-dependent endonuclease of OLD family